MTHLLHTVRDLSVRWKIILPFVLLATVTWFVAASILERSSTEAITTQSRAEARRVSDAAAHHLALRVRFIGREVAIQCLEAEVFVGHVTAENTVDAIRPGITEMFMRDTSLKRPFLADLVKVVDGDNRAVVDLRLNRLTTSAVEDKELIATAREELSAEGIITTTSESPTTYVAGAAGIKTADPKSSILIMGIELDDEMLDEMGLSATHDVFVVGPKGIIGATGPTADSAELREAVQLATGDEMTVGDSTYAIAETPITLDIAPDLRVVAVIPLDGFVADTGAQVQAWLVLALGIAAFLVLALWLSNTLTRPLRAVTAVAQELTDGNMTARAPISSKDEIGTLANAFNRMGDELARRDARLSEAFAELKFLSETDALTGLLNYRAIHAAIEREIALAKRHYRVFSIVILDIDNLKLINDTYGHAAGDTVIRQVADVARNSTRESDLVGRHGGDEFMMILPRTTTTQAHHVADKLRDVMLDHPFIAPDGGLHVPIRFSLGVATFPDDGDNSAAILARADENLYTSKRRGGDMITSGHEPGPARKTLLRGFSILDSLVIAVDNKDRYTYQHSEDVTRLALLIADELGLDEPTQDILRTAGLLHDVGKIGVPDTLLRKPGRLTPLEYEHVKRHPAMGAALIQGIPDEEEIRAAIVSHHEHWDGSGFPRGLRGTEIPLLGRILAAADAYSAITSHRPYRKALPDSEAIEQLVAGAGTQFDPDVVAAFVHAIQLHEAVGAQPVATH